MRISTVAVALIICSAPLLAEEPRADSWGKHRQELSREIRPLLGRYCIECHSGNKARAKIDLKSVSAPTSPSSSELATWKRVWDIVQAREMPPAGESQPNDAERSRLKDWLLRVLTTPEAGQRPNPGNVVARRLNQVEYNNTLFELFGFNRRTTGLGEAADGASVRSPFARAGQRYPFGCCRRWGCRGTRECS